MDLLAVPGRTFTKPICDHPGCRTKRGGNTSSKKTMAAHSSQHFLKSWCVTALWKTGRGCLKSRIVHSYSTQFLLAPKLNQEWES